MSTLAAMTDVNWANIIEILLIVLAAIGGWLKTNKLGSKIDEVDKKTDAQSDELTLQTEIMQGDAKATAKPSPLKASRLAAKKKK